MGYDDFNVNDINNTENGIKKYFKQVIERKFDETVQADLIINKEYKNNWNFITIHL